MAQLTQCDFCGNITNTIAAEIVIQVTPQVAGKLAGRVELREEIYAYNERGVLRRDCCITCLDKFVEVKPVPLAITPTGEAVTQDKL